MKLKYLIAALMVLLLVGCSHEVTRTTVKSEPAAPKSEIIATGMGDTKMKISPSVDNKIKGTVTIELTQVLPDTQIAAFGIVKQGEDGMGTPNFDTDASDGWSYILDTTTLANGVYTISAVTGDELEGDGPDGHAQVQVVIEN